MRFFWQFVKLQEIGLVQSILSPHLFTSVLFKSLYRRVMMPGGIKNKMATGRKAISDPV